MESLALGLEPKLGLEPSFYSNNNENFLRFKMMQQQFLYAPLTIAPKHFLQFWIQIVRFQSDLIAL